MEPSNRTRLWFAAVALALALCSCDDNSTTAHEPDASANAVDDTPLLRFVPVELEGDQDLIVHFAFIPGRPDEFLALRHTGEVLHYRLNDQEPASLLGVAEVPGVFFQQDCGVNSLAFDPDFESNRVFYVSACFSVFDSGILQMRFSDDYLKMSKSALEVARLEGPPETVHPIHNAGRLGFDADGNLWAQFGDKNLKTPAADPSNWHGSLIKLRPRIGEAGYDLPDPPIKGLPKDADPHVYAFGFRSPWTGLLDRHGFHWVADVGSRDGEEINVITGPARDYGWPRHTGPCKENDACESPTIFWTKAKRVLALDDPEANDTTRRAAWVGLEYKPEDNDRYDGALTNKVLYGDLCVGFVRAAAVDEDGELESDEHVGHLADVTGWAQAADGYIYAVEFGQCTSLGERPVLAGKMWRAELARKE